MTTRSWLRLALFVLAINCAWGLLAEELAKFVPPPVSASEYVPDPASVMREGAGYRYAQNGWIVVHIEGAPYERGYQHGKLLAAEIVDNIKATATARSPKAPADAWRDMRLMSGALFLRGYDAEYLEEMKGIADGAAAAGAKYEGRPLDMQDVVALNSSLEVDFLTSGVAAAPTGLEEKEFREPADGKPRHEDEEHCSAFAATGPATADGQIVFGHITMFSLYIVRHFNVWLDVQPKEGHRVVMQTYPGGIMSGLDYYMNDAGLLCCETTIGQTGFHAQGTPLVARIRRALQYADSIDKAVEILLTSNNGLYSNEWLLADTKTGEIASFELGTHTHKLWRSSKGEFPGGTTGFYWGCNNAKDLELRKETHPSLKAKPANLVFFPRSRDVKWLELYEAHKGKIDTSFGFRAFTTPPLAAFASCDAKFTTTALAKEMKSWALFGPPLGRTWDATAEEARRLPDIQPLVSNEWTLVSVAAPAKADVQLAAADLAPFPKQGADEESAEARFARARSLPPAWRGSLLPESDADIWLAAAFADYEKIVAQENWMKKQAKGGTLDAACAGAAGDDVVCAPVAVAGRGAKAGQRLAAGAGEVAMERGCVVRHCLGQGGDAAGFAARELGAGAVRQGSRLLRARACRDGGEHTAVSRTLGESGRQVAGRRVRSVDFGRRHTAGTGTALLVGRLVRSRAPAGADRVRLDGRSGRAARDGRVVAA